MRMKSIAPADGPVVVFLPGLGAVATTFIAGVESVRRGLTLPVGSLTQMQTIRVGPRSQQRSPLIRELVPLAALDQLRFAAWDIRSDDAHAAAERAAVLEPRDLEPVAGCMREVVPMRAAFDPYYVKRLSGDHVKPTTSKRDLVEALREDIRRRMAEARASRAVMVWCGSTEIHLKPAPCHGSVDAFEAGLAANDPAITPSQLYAYAAICEGVPYANGAPNLAADCTALETLANERCVPIAGKDFKTGQTLMKTVLAPGLKARMLGVRGWFSTNILGNRDGEVLDDPQSFQAKEATKSNGLESVLQPELYPQLYGNLYHKVRINYYPPRGDAKEGWDNIDIFGWMGYPMQIKVDFLCRDSILAAPIVLDLVLLLDLAHRAGFGGIQEWLSFYFKCPQVAEGHVPEHDLFIQHLRLKNTLRVLAGHEPLTHLTESHA
ncbi:MAG: inositol-3-phosphate synthase [Myxococcales bacterium FL481]|nr:MAG: inositol-3-phosphate synthase [Myxococcales bacterium FL481]